MQEHFKTVHHPYLKPWNILKGQHNRIFVKEWFEIDSLT